MATKKAWHPNKKFRPQPKGKPIPIHLLTKCYSRLEPDGNHDALAMEFCKRVIFEHKADLKTLALLRRFSALWTLALAPSPAVVVASGILYAAPLKFIDSCRKRGLVLLCTASGVEFARPDMATDADRYGLVGCREALWQWLSPATTCCLCGGPLPEGRHYICTGCAI